MQQAEISLQQGDLDTALTALQNQIRSEPANPKLRIFLFQLLALSGQWDRALNQLKLVGELDAASLLMVQTYQTALVCEALRSQVFAGKHSPLIFGDPQLWVAELIEALRLEAAGNLTEAYAMRNQALQQAPAISGSINNENFAWLADADIRFGPILEAIVNGRYYWIPFQQIRSLKLEEPTDLRDMIWMPAEFTWINGGQASGLIPTRYPGAESSADNLIRMARKTEWIAVATEIYQGSGQRLLATDAQDYALLDVRHIQFDPLV